MTLTSGIRPTQSVLDRIVADKLPVLEKRKRGQTVAVLEAASGKLGQRWSMRTAIGAGSRARPDPTRKCQIIAEIKKASPSKGQLVASLDHLAIARAYTNAGAAAV